MSGNPALSSAGCLASTAFSRMRTQKAKVFDQTVIPAEMVKEHNDIYKLLGIKPAKEYPIKDRPNV